MYNTRYTLFIILWGLPQVPFIGISLLVALSLAADFGNDTFVRTVVLVTVWLFLNMLYYLCQAAACFIASRFLPYFRLGHLSQPDAVSLSERDSDVVVSVPSELHECISAYTVRVMSVFLDRENLNILLEDIRLYTVSQYPDSLAPVRTKIPVNPRDIKHFIWNIGTRLNYSGSSKAAFAKAVFPEVLHGQSLETIIRTLRQDGKCSISLDTPKPGSFRFSDEV